MHNVLRGAVLVVAFGAVTALAQSVPPAALPDVVKDLAPTGKLRAAINAGNVVLVQKDAAGGEPRGITVDLARELARRLGVAADLIVYETAGKVTDAVKTGAWDIGFIAIEPARAAVIGFTAPYVIIEGTYIVARIRPQQHCRRRPRRRAHPPSPAALPTIFSSHARCSTRPWYTTQTPPLALQGFITDKLDAAAGVKQQLVQFAKTNSNVRVMDGRFQEIKEAMGTPLGRDLGLRYLRSFVEEMKASGFVKKALERANQPDAVIAPPAEN